MRMYFLDSTDDKKYEYNQDGFARFHNQIIGSGVSDVNSLEVSAKTNMDVAIGSGWIFSNGFSLELEKSETLTHDVSDQENDRIDRVIIRFDTNPEGRDFYPVILKGTPSSSPTPPSLTRDNYIQEMSLSQVRVVAGKSFIEQSQITDERANDSVCGYIPLHNIYRGMDINEHGMVTMPNQSYVEMNDLTSTALDGKETGSVFTHNKIPITPLIDRQDEIIDGVFYPKSSGTFLFSMHVRLEEIMPENSKLESFFIINDDEEINSLLYTFNTYGRNQQFYGTALKYLDKGDKVELVIGTLRLVDYVTDYKRLNIAKIN